MSLYLESLRTHCRELNSLNVYPVPDGDTGTNLVLTQESVAFAIAGLDQRADLSALVEAIARGSLIGARGNSGVILSQVLRAIGERLPMPGPAQGPDLAAALEAAAKGAYGAVAVPVEGTALTVVGDAALAAAGAAAEGASCQQVAAAALAESRISLARTTELLPELRLAGVVDSGAKGIVLLLDALYAALADEPVSEPVGELGPVGSVERDGAPWEEGFAYEVQYLLEADDEALAEVRRALTSIGDSVVVVGGGGVFNVHVHTDHPDDAVETGCRVGRARQVSVERLEDRRGPCIGFEARGARLGERACAMVAVADGEALRAILRSLGATAVLGVDAGPQEMLDPIRGAPAEGVVILGGHGEVTPSGSPKRVGIVASRAVPAGLAAAAAFNPARPLEANLEAMRAAAAACRCGEVIRATGESGGWRSLAERRMVASGVSLCEAAVAVVGALSDGRSELLTVVVGEAAVPEDRDTLARVLRDAFAGLALQVLDGGQPGPPFQVGVE